MQELNINTKGWDDTELKCKKCGNRSVMSLSPGCPLPKSMPDCQCGANDYVQLKVVK